MKYWLWAFVVFAGIGCSKQDTDGLNEVGRRVVDRVKRVAGGPDGSVSLGWRGARASLDQTNLTDRVYLRLKWDEYLADTDIEVRVPEPGVVELRGAIAEASLRQRAVDLAQSTRGVAKVVENWTE